MIIDILKSFVYKTGFELKKRSPEILTGVGIVGVVTGTVMACVATTKLEKTMEPHRQKLNDIHENPNPDESEHRKEIVSEYGKTALDLIKLYGPSVAVESASIGCLLGSHKIMRNRNAALAAAYTTVSKAFEAYKDRVAENIGPDKEKEIRYGIKEEEVEEEYTDKKGNKKTRKKTVKTMDGGARSPYSIFWTAGCNGWDKDPGVSKRNLFEKQAWANERLKRRGHVVLNEVYELLGAEPTREGLYVGWYYDPSDPSLHNKIDFGVFDCSDILKCDFVNGWEDTVILDFNVDGNIVDRFKVNNEKEAAEFYGGR